MFSLSIIKLFLFHAVYKPFYKIFIKYGWAIIYPLNYLNPKKINNFNFHILRASSNSSVTMVEQLVFITTCFKNTKRNGTERTIHNFSIVARISIDKNRSTLFTYVFTSNYFFYPIKAPKKLARTSRPMALETM